jgi:hypothetical protein
VRPRGVQHCREVLDLTSEPGVFAVGAAPAPTAPIRHEYREGIRQVTSQRAEVL